MPAIEFCKKLVDDTFEIAHPTAQLELAGACKLALDTASERGSDVVREAKRIRGYRLGRRGPAVLFIFVQTRRGGTSAGCLLGCTKKIGRRVRK